MLERLSSCLLRLLPIIATTPNGPADPVPRFFANDALATVAAQATSADGGQAVEAMGAAMITPGPKFPALMRRQGSSFVGYYSEGSGCELD
jgi:hypothetical protein